MQAQTTSPTKHPQTNSDRLLGEENTVYERIQKSFVQGWATGKPTSFSMLLYGPPGTGKTTVAESLSDALGMRLITVTVSDFLGSGGEQVETRAKAIFQTLEAQIGAVILFDEIDSFLLDRDSNRYSKQDSLFQFLTPGMLTKLNDLRKRERSIFIVATNYENRIDAAIKRTGRIDHKYLLPLPNADRRLAILKDLWVEINSMEVELRKESVLRGYSDLKGAVNGVKASKDSSQASDILEEIKNAKPAASISGYLRRLGNDEEVPDEEFSGLLHLVEEVEATELMQKEFEAADYPGQQLLLGKYKDVLTNLGINTNNPKQPESV